MIVAGYFIAIMKKMSKLKTPTKNPFKPVDLRKKLLSVEC